MTMQARTRILNNFGKRFMRQYSLYESTIVGNKDQVSFRLKAHKPTFAEVQYCAKASKNIIDKLNERKNKKIKRYDHLFLSGCNGLSSVGLATYAYYILNQYLTFDIIEYMIIYLVKKKSIISMNIIALVVVCGITSMRYLKSSIDYEKQKDNYNQIIEELNSSLK